MVRAALAHRGRETLRRCERTQSQSSRAESGAGIVRLARCQDRCNSGTFSSFARVPLLARARAAPFRKVSARIAAHRCHVAQKEARPAAIGGFARTATGYES